MYGSVTDYSPQLHGDESRLGRDLYGATHKEGKSSNYNSSNSGNSSNLG